MRISDWSSDVCSSDLVECCDDVVLGRAQQDLLKHGIGNGVLDYYVLASVRVLELHPGPAIQQLGAKLVAGHFIAPLLEGTLGELHDVALVDNGDGAAVIVDGVLQRLANETLRTFQ